MRFGIFGSAQARRGGPDVDSGAGFRDFVQYNVEAEALGFHSTFVVEHHFTGFGQISATLNLLTWIGARTSTLRLGTAVMTLPWHWTGLQGQWRRIAAFDYSNPLIASWGPWVIVSLIGGIVLMISALMFVWNLVTLHRSSGYSNHRHVDRARGRVDFMYVRNHTAERVFASVRQLPGPGGRVIPIAKPEHLIAMKVQAIRDAPERTWQDLADIGYLLRLEGLDREEVRGYFVRAGLEEKWHELARAL